MFSFNFSNVEKRLFINILADDVRIMFRFNGKDCICHCVSTTSRKKAYFCYQLLCSLFAGFRKGTNSL